jgi:hypothetical protein
VAALAAVDALIGIAPRDEFEGMIAAQLIAAHNAAMECYRRAMFGDQTFEGRRENLFYARLLRGERGATARRRATSILHHFPYTNLTALETDARRQGLR